MSTQLSVNEKEAKKNILSRHPILLSVIGVVLVAAIVLSAIFVPAAIEDNLIKKQELTAVGTCAGYNIPYEELRWVAYNYRTHLESLHGKGIWDSGVSAAKHAPELEALVMENLNTTYAVYALCEKLGVPLDSDEANDYVEVKLKELKDYDSFEGNSKKFKAYLAENRMTEHLLKESLRSAYLELAALEAMVRSGEIKYSTDNLTDFVDYVTTSPEYARTLHVFIANKSGQTVTQATKRAQEITDALRAKTTLEGRFELLCQYIQTDSNDYQMTTTDGYYFAKGEHFFTEGLMNAEYETATFELAVGDVSDPLVTEDGVFVIMRLSPESKYVMTNRSTLLENYQSAVLGQALDTMRQQHPAVLNDYGKTLVLWDLD